MALTAKFHLQLLPGGAGFKGIATRANYLGVLIVFGMNLVFHTTLASVNADLPLPLTGWLEFNHAVNKGIEGIILAHAHIITLMDTSAPLPHQNGAGIHTLAGISLHAESFGLTIAPVAGGAASLFMSHSLSPPLSCAVEPSSSARPT